MIRFPCELSGTNRKLEVYHWSDTPSIQSRLKELEFVSAIFFRKLLYNRTSLCVNKSFSQPAKFIGSRSPRGKLRCKPYFSHIYHIPDRNDSLSEIRDLKTEDTRQAKRAIRAVKIFRQRMNAKLNVHCTSDLRSVLLKANRGSFYKSAFILSQRQVELIELIESSLIDGVNR